MNRSFSSLVLAAALAASAALAVAGPQEPQNAGAVQPVSWDAWLAAKTNAERCDTEGNLVAALQYYLEYVRQARGLNSPVRVAWGLNNAAYMIIKMFRQDPTVDLAPAKRFLEEGLSIPEILEDCRKVLAQNLEYVRASLGSPR